MSSDVTCFSSCSIRNCLVQVECIEAILVINNSDSKLNVHTILVLSSENIVSDDYDSDEFEILSSIILIDGSMYLKYSAVIQSKLHYYIL